MIKVDGFTPVQRGGLQDIVNSMREAYNSSMAQRSPKMLSDMPVRNWREVVDEMFAVKPQQTPKQVKPSSEDLEKARKFFGIA